MAGKIFIMGYHVISPLCIHKTWGLISSDLKYENHGFSLDSSPAFPVHRDML